MNDRGETLTHVVTREGEVHLLEEPLVLGDLVDYARERRLEPREVGPARVGVDVVDEREDVLGVAGIVLQCNVDLYLVFVRGERDRIGMERLAAPAQMLHELFETVAVKEDLFLRFITPFVTDREGHAAVQECQFPETACDRVVIETGLDEDLGVGLEKHLGAGPLGITDPLQPLGRDAALERHVVDGAVAGHPDVEPLGERVHHRHADPVLAACPC